MRSITCASIAMILTTLGPAFAQTITVDEVVTKIVLADALIDDFTADVIQNQGQPDEVRGTAVTLRANRSRITMTEDGAATPIDRLAVTDFVAFSYVDNDAGTVVNRDLGLDPANSDLRSLHRLVEVSPFLQWRFLGGDVTTAVAGNDQYTLQAVGSDLDFRIVVDLSLGAMVHRELYIADTLTVEETWSAFVAVGNGANLPTHYVADYLQGTEVSTVDFSNFAINQNPDKRIFQTP
jgi:outer membrane lipoprotein-sorting protein